MVVGRGAVTGSLVAALVLAAAALPVPPAAPMTARATTRAALRPMPFQPAPRPTLQMAANLDDTGCGDDSATWMGTRWRGEMRWRFNPATVPGYLPVADTRAAVVRAAANIAGAANACGLPAGLGLAERYRGPTIRHAAVRSDGRCGRPDGSNDVSFGDLAAGLLAVTCLWWRPGGRGRDGTTVEADIRISATPGLFFLTGPTTCDGSWDLEGALTHEFGHAFGLGHVSADKHPGLTMADTLPPCDTAHRGLGLGDYTMLRSHY